MIITTNYGYEASRTYRLKVPTIDAICFTADVVEAIYLRGRNGCLQWGQARIEYIAYSHATEVKIGDAFIMFQIGDYLAKNEYGELKHYKRSLFLDSWEPDNANE